MAPVLTWLITARASQRAVWEPPPWAEAPATAAGRHALAERSEPPTWELQQPESREQRLAEQAAGDQVETAKPAKARKAAKAKVSRTMLLLNGRICSAGSLQMTPIQKSLLRVCACRLTLASYATHVCV